MKSPFVSVRKICAWGLPALALLAGCSKEPGGQVVAVVNNQEITEQEVEAQAMAEGISGKATYKSAAPAVLQRVIERNLMADYARDQGLDRSPDFLARRRIAEQTLLAAIAVDKLAGPQRAPTPAEINAFIAANPTQFAKRETLKLDQIRFATPKDPAALKQLTSLATLDLIEAELRRQGTPVYRADVAVDTAALQPQVAKQIVALPPGELFDISVDGTTLVSVILSRAPVAASSEQWNGMATAALRKAALEKAVSARVNDLRKTAKIKIAPDYLPSK